MDKNCSILKESFLKKTCSCPPKWNNLDVGVRQTTVGVPCTLIYGGIRSEESVWPKADWRAALLAEGRLARGLVDSRLMDFEFRDIQKPTDKVSFDVARLRVYRKSEVIVS